MESFVRTMEPWIITYEGHKFNYRDDAIDTIDIADIAHALSNNCRYTGHVKRFYSVAEHCVWASTIVPPQFALEGLLHDASEAYLSDMASPVKQFLVDYKTEEDKIMARIARKFNLAEGFHKLPEIKLADLRMLKSEAKALMRNVVDEEWGFADVEPGVQPHCFSPDAAKMMFLMRYMELTNGL